MADPTWLMYAAIAVWLVLGGYLFLLGRKTASLATRLRRLEYAARPPHGQTRDEGR